MPEIRSDMCEDCKYWQYTGVNYSNVKIGSCCTLTKDNRLYYGNDYRDVKTVHHFYCADFEKRELRRQIGNLELRHLGQNRHEIVLWDGATMAVNCIAIAYWINNDGWELRFVYDRPFKKEVNKDDFWTLAKMGQDYLDAI